MGRKLRPRAVIYGGGENGEGRLIDYKGRKRLREAVIYGPGP
jgi:hypothetical protein